MRITGKDLERLAHLSRLEVAEEEKASYLHSLDAILEYLDVVNKLDTGSVEPAAHIPSLRNVFREDKLQSGLAQERVLANAPEEQAGMFTVPRIV
ncbi:MAG: Asp-tRNA(Asn)/Glu-tRNA(Gln) amidotransferase subunit GatC [Peptococcaceae bacterium]|nr:Asp-tRNA(Asn)/Glu-tRNA(Gln) amidotransferase subunit GatC [Peptococcaceae bacterium]